MPFDLERIQEDHQTSYATASYAELLNAPRISGNFKNWVLIQLQRSGLNAGLIKVSDFMRLNPIEDVELQRKKRDEFQRWLDAFKFQFATESLKNLIHGELNWITTIKNKINSRISELKASPSGTSAQEIHEYQHIREDMDDYKEELNTFERRRRRAKSVEEIETIETEVIDRARYYRRPRRAESDDAHFRESPTPTYEVYDHGTDTARGHERDIDFSSSSEESPEERKKRLEELARLRATMARARIEGTNVNHRKKPDSTDDDKLAPPAP